MALNVGTQLGHYSVTALMGEGVLGFAEHILTNAARLWVELGIDGKQDLQQVLSPQGLSFDRQEFGTAVTSLTFKHCEALRPTGTDVVSLSTPSLNSQRSTRRCTHTRCSRYSGNTRSTAPRTTSSSGGSRGR